MRTEKEEHVEQYMTNKTAKYTIRFYVFINSEIKYSFSIFDNGKGVNPCSTRYYTVCIHYKLRQPNISFSNNNKDFVLTKIRSCSKIEYITKS